MINYQIHEHVGFVPNMGRDSNEVVQKAFPLERPLPLGGDV
jgi:hypothetical protein